MVARGQATAARRARELRQGRRARRHLTPIGGRPALIVDDVFDSGRTIAYARAHLMAKGATRTLACAFVRKPQALNEPIEAFAWDAPDNFLIGYGMDDAGRYRGLPYIAALNA